MFSDESIKLPANWTPMADGQSLAVVELPSSSPEYQEVEKTFKASMGATTTNIKKVNN